MRLMKAISPSSPSANIVSGVGAAANNARVARFCSCRWPVPGKG